MMGSRDGDEDAYENEYGPEGRPFPVEIGPFRLAAYPVTCAQFRPFVTGDGYVEVLGAVVIPEPTTLLIWTVSIAFPGTFPPLSLMP